MSDSELSRLGRHVAEQQDAALTASEPSETSRRFLAEYAAQRVAPDASESSLRAPHPLFSWLRLSLAVLLVIGVFALKEAVFWKPPLSFTIGAWDESGVLRDWESAPEDARLPIRFSDGTLVELEPRARARVVAVGRAGAEIVIESGRAHVHVVPARFRLPGEAAWRVSLGPFSVEVKGTRFDVDWDPRSDDFALDLFEGTVSVSGCESGHVHTLVAGQGVRASCSKKQWSLVSATDPAAPARPAVAEPPVPGAPEAAPRPNSPPAVDALDTPDAGERAPEAPLERSSKAAPGRVHPGPAWRTLAEKGLFEAAFEAALAAGFEAECERARPDDLTLLGDTARLNADSERARTAYIAARRRAPGSAAAARAAFALGRLAVESDREEAKRWFERYLDERPHGPLAAAADDRLFELEQQSDSPARRREAARTYLERRPQGAHTPDARRILDAAQP